MRASDTIKPINMAMVLIVSDYKPSTIIPTIAYRVRHCSSSFAKRDNMAWRLIKLKVGVFGNLIRIPSRNCRGKSLRYYFFKRHARPLFKQGLSSSCPQKRLVHFQQLLNPSLYGFPASPTRDAVIKPY